MTRRGLLAVILVVLLLAGCLARQNTGHRQAEADNDGVQVTGTIDGAHVAISEGVPEVTFGDCDAGDGLDQDVCWIARTIDGMQVALVIENPSVLVAGETVAVVGSACGACDDVTEGVVVDLRVDGGQRRATNGRLEVTRVDERIAAGVDLRWAGGDQLTGSFNIRELRPEEL